MSDSLKGEEPGSPDPSQTEFTKPTKRIRWATHRLTGLSDTIKRQSTDFSKRHSRLGKLLPKHSHEKNKGKASDDGVVDEDDGSSRQRRIFANQTLPPEDLDEDGNPRQIFVRNKIRTSKYTALSFIPKNLWFQFHNIANIYFLFIIILSIFSIFGASNPGLGSVPLIAIVTITAIKDAIEDYRRTVLDNELNNSPIHRLVGFKNVNVMADNVSTWRKLKKSVSHSLYGIWVGFLIVTKQRKPTSDKPFADGTSRKSIETHRRQSGETGRTSFHSTRTKPDDIPMTEVQPQPAAQGQNIVPRPGYSPRQSYESGAQRRGMGLLRSISNQTSPIAEKFRRSSDMGHIDGMMDDAITPVPSSSGDAPAVPQARQFGSVIDPSLEPSGQAKFKPDYWKNVVVGDFVRIYNNDEIPADIVVLATSDTDGACYIETKNLDGETNLKVRQALQCSRAVRHARDCEQASFQIEAEPPHANLYSFSGVIRWNQKDIRKPEETGAEMAEPISINNMLLRGSSLRNTDWALGIVLFTGQESKIMLNAGITPSKRSRITRELNWSVLYNFGILFIMCLTAGLVQGITWSSGHNSLDFFEFGSIGGSPPLDGFITFWSALILFQNLVPISLYISVEIIRTLQAYFIYGDIEMYYAPIDYPCTPKSWNISDDVGQIEYVFSDKTGTLTQNVMEFKKCTVNGVAYGEAYTEAQAGMERRQGVDVEEAGARAREQIARDRVGMLEKLRNIHDNPFLDDDKLTFVAPDFVEDLQGEHGTEQKEAASHFMLALALCHTVITEKVPGDKPTIEFKAQSPDEAALVATARDCGFSLIGRTKNGMLVNSQGVQKEYEVLNTLEFNSTRKRMSSILRMPDNGKILLICKGADSMIYSRLKRGEQPQLRASTAEHLEMFAREGLRTLCIAERWLGEEEYEAWNKRYEAAANSLVDREDKLDAVADEIERDFTLLGGTAIEDRLQDGVPDTIALLADGGIKLWVLTGDKVETAINIGFSCNLLNNDMDLIVIKHEEENEDAVEEELDRQLALFGLTGSDEELAEARKNHEPPQPTHALIIDGDSLKVVLEDHLRQKFLLLCKQCKSVLCCRVSPSQKAAVVQLVKVSLDVMTLSIGDGANDVAMIQEADVGVGIAGVEGRAAVMSSDYAIGQFRFLQRLILVHGRWSYVRLAETIANFFYKNIVWTFTLFWYQIYANFDCPYLFEYTYILLYNLAFTSLPVIVMGILDQDVSDKVALAVPQLYRRGIERLNWRPLKFWSYMIDGLYQSVMCFFMTEILVSYATPLTHTGQDVSDRVQMGVYVANATIVVVNVFTLLNVQRWDWLILTVISVSTLLIWFWTGVYSAFTSSNLFYKSAPHVYGQLSFWALTFLTIIICLLPRFAGKSFQKVFFPRDVDIVREQIRLGKFDHLKEQPARDTPSQPPSTASSGSDPKRQRRRLSVFKPGGPLPHPHLPNISSHLPHIGKRRSSPPALENSNDDALISPRLRLERTRSSFDRMRLSMDKTRPSFEASHDFTSAALLTRMESSHSAHPSITSLGAAGPHGASKLRESHQTSQSM